MAWLSDAWRKHPLQPSHQQVAAPRSATYKCFCMRQQQCLKRAGAGLEKIP